MHDIARPDPDVAPLAAPRARSLPAASVAGRGFVKTAAEIECVPDEGGKPSHEWPRSLDGGIAPERGHASATDDAALLAKSAVGDATAFRSLVERHLANVTAIARSILRDPAEAQDVAQEAFLRLWRHAGDLEIGSGGAKPWLRRIVSNMCIDRLRAGRNTTVTDDVPDRPEPASQGRALEEQEMAARVRTALDALPERQKQALTLFHFEGLSQLEICDVLDISEDAVESLLARARRSLKAALKDEWRQLLPDGPAEGGMT